MAFRITGLAPDPFRHLFGLDDAALASQGAIRYRVDSGFGFPDRIELRDATPGETVLLVNHVHQPADTPFRASHAIFVREGAPRPSTPSTPCRTRFAAGCCRCARSMRRT